MHELYKQKDLPYLNVTVCKNCEHLVPLNLKVCPRCGHPINEDVNVTPVDEFSTQTIELETPIVQPSDTEEKSPVEETTSQKSPNKKPSLFLRQFFNVLLISACILGIFLLLFSNYFNFNELAKDGTIYSAKMTGLDILTFNKDALVLTNGLQSISIFSSNPTYQTIGFYTLFVLYVVMLSLLIIGLISSFVRLIKRKKPMTKLLGIILIPSAFLWLLSYTHALLFASTSFMKENQFQVGVSSIYLFLLLFICWIIVIFIFIKDDNSSLPTKEKKKKTIKENDDLFAD